MTKKQFIPGASACGCGSRAFKWLDDAPCCPRCERRDAARVHDVPRSYAPSNAASPHCVPLSAEVHDGALTMNDMAILEAAL